MARIGFLTGSLLLFLTSAASAQLSSLTVSVTGGSIRNLQHESYRDLPQYAFYPELQIESKLASLADKTASLRGALYWGFWDDGVRQPSGSCVDCITYSYSSHITGARFSFAFDRGFLPLVFSTGLARHFVSAEYVGGFDFGGRPGSDFRRTFNTAEVGLSARVRIIGALELEAGMRQFMPLPIEQHIIQAVIGAERRAFQIGFSYTLNV